MPIRESSFKHRLVEKMVAARTSFTYVWTTLGLILGWILINRLGIAKWDNDDLTYLNLTLSTLAEVQGVVLLIYMARITQKQHEGDKVREKHAVLLTRLTEMQKAAHDLEDDVVAAREELNEE